MRKILSGNYASPSNLCLTSLGDERVLRTLPGELESAPFARQNRAYFAKRNATLIGRYRIAIDALALVNRVTRIKAGSAMTV